MSPSPTQEDFSPAVLVQLRDELEKHDGLLVEGVFRVAPAQDAQRA